MAAKKNSGKGNSADRPPTKGEIYSHIASDTGLTRKQVSAVFESLGGLIKRNVGRKGPGLFAVPGLMKIRVVTRPATKARKGINPFTGQEMMFKAKPARKVVKARPVKAVKDAV